MLRRILHGFLRQRSISFILSVGIRAGKKAAAKRVRIMNQTVRAWNIVDADAFPVWMDLQVSYNVLAYAICNLEVLVFWEMVVRVKERLSYQRGPYNGRHTLR